VLLPLRDGFPRPPLRIGPPGSLVLSIIGDGRQPSAFRVPGTAGAALVRAPAALATGAEAALVPAGVEILERVARLSRPGGCAVAGVAEDHLGARELVDRYPRVVDSSVEIGSVKDDPDVSDCAQSVTSSSSRRMPRCRRHHALRRRATF